MSWSRRRLIAAGFALGPALSGCGWQPMYGNAKGSANPATGGTQTGLAAIRIDPIEQGRIYDPLRSGISGEYDGQIAQWLYNALRDALNPGGRPAQPLYALQIKLSERTAGTLAVGNSETTREDLHLTAEYNLLDARDADMAKLFEDKAKIVTGYDILNDPYSDISTRNAARRRAAEQIASMIETRLAAFLANRA